jgi:hypothetical protein
MVTLKKFLFKVNRVLFDRIEKVIDTLPTEGERGLALDQMWDGEQETAELIQTIVRSDNQTWQFRKVRDTLLEWENPYDPIMSMCAVCFRHGKAPTLDSLRSAYGDVVDNLTYDAVNEEASDE